MRSRRCWQRRPRACTRRTTVVIESPKLAPRSILTSQIPRQAGWHPRVSNRSLRPSCETRRTRVRPPQSIASSRSPKTCSRIPLRASARSTTPGSRWSRSSPCTRAKSSSSASTNCGCSRSTICCSAWHGRWLATRMVHSRVRLPSATRLRSSTNSRIPTTPSTPSCVVCSIARAARCSWWAIRSRQSMRFAAPTYSPICALVKMRRCACRWKSIVDRRRSWCRPSTCCSAASPHRSPLRASTTRLRSRSPTTPIPASCRRRAHRCRSGTWRVRSVKARPRTKARYGGAQRRRPRRTSPRYWPMPGVARRAWWSMASGARCMGAISR